ncbi:hypothetical protein ORI99_00335 [Alishewanella sp. SMS9]|uniref:hypothetical protein n=1 Tax=Pseudoalteromonas tunicata TaxID=314281 RepID=UPI00273FCBA5|nr:hypothetical protein [Pseudoalteromonas tunicata]MDP5205496.1 hypothetical protein [Alishewanella sp. SMS9]MDP5215507.1 hypothetical protein [Pseudoalteromonas tunicata]
MNRVFKILIWLGKIAFIISAIVVIAFYLWLPDMCGNYFHSERFSPNGEFKAVTFQRDCGATTGFSTQISILDADDKLENEMGNVFRMSGHPDKVAPNVVWESDSVLKIDKHITGKEYFTETSYGWFNPIKVQYGG